jgi:hypothetical protein
MTLAALIRGRRVGISATSIPAIPATATGGEGASVARIATIAVATCPARDRDQWPELESLLAIVAPAYSTPTHEYAEIREVAATDLAAALTCFRELARQVQAAKALGTLRANDKPKLEQAQ